MIRFYYFSVLVFSKIWSEISSLTCKDYEKMLPDRSVSIFNILENIYITNTFPHLKALYKIPNFFKPF